MTDAAAVPGSSPADPASTPGAEAFERELRGLTDDQVADGIVAWSARLAVGEARLVALVAELDRRDAWYQPGLLSCAHWLSWRVGMGLTAARERVRVARSLRELPELRGAFAAGQVSWSQVRAITRVAKPADRVDWVDLAQNASGAQLERICRGLRRAQQVDEDEADPHAAEERMRTTIGYDHDGALRISIRVGAADGAVLLAALNAVRDELTRAAAEGPPDDSAESSAAPDSCPGRFDPAGAGSPADAASGPSDLIGQDEHAGGESAESFTAAAGARITWSAAVLELARRALAQPAAGHRGAQVSAALTAHVDPRSGWARLADDELLPPQLTHQLLGPLLGPGEVLRLRAMGDQDWTGHDLGRGSRLASAGLRQQLGAIDGERCRFPGCDRKRRLHAHHVVFWSAGGATDLANLVLVCNRHHTLIHQDGFQLILRPDRSLEVSTSAGTPVPAVPARGSDGAADGTVAPTEASGRVLRPNRPEGRMDLGYVVAVLYHQNNAPLQTQV